MKCEDVSLLLNAVLDRELTDIERTKVDKHLDECSACREEFADLLGIDETLKRALKPPVMDFAIDRVHGVESFLQPEFELGTDRSLTRPGSVSQKLRCQRCRTRFRKLSQVERHLPARISHLPGQVVPVQGH